MKYRAKLELYDVNDDRVAWMQSAELDVNDRRGWRAAAWEVASALIGWIRARRDA